MKRKKRQVKDDTIHFRTYSVRKKKLEQLAEKEDVWLSDLVEEGIDYIFKDRGDDEHADYSDHN